MTVIDGAIMKFGKSLRNSLVQRRAAIQSLTVTMIVTIPQGSNIIITTRFL